MTVTFSCTPKVPRGDANRLPFQATPEGAGSTTTMVCCDGCLGGTNSAYPPASLTSTVGNQPPVARGFFRQNNTAYVRFHVYALLGVVHNIFREKGWLSFEAAVAFFVKKRKALVFLVRLYLQIKLPP